MPKIGTGVFIILISIVSLTEHDLWYISLIFVLLGIVVILGGLGENALDMQRENDPKWDEDLQGMSDFLEHFIKPSQKIMYLVNILVIIGLIFVVLILLIMFGLPVLPSRF